MINNLLLIVYRRIKEEKEKEVARLREMQEKASDRQVIKNFFIKQKILIYRPSLMPLEQKELKKWLRDYLVRRN